MQPPKPLLKRLSVPALQYKAIHRLSEVLSVSIVEMRDPIPKDQWGIASDTPCRFRWFGKFTPAQLSKCHCFQNSGLVVW